MVELITPPITSVASRRWTSAPRPVARAIGTNPSEATSAVITTPLSLVKEPTRMAS